MAERPADVFAPLESTAVVEPTAASTMARLVMRLHPGTSTAVAEQKMAGDLPEPGAVDGRGPESCG